MDSVREIMQVCRLCLDKDEVNIPIFEEQGDIRQIFLKITACLPVKVSLEDNLPKKICDGCSNKLELLYDFWNTSANAEKQLLTWLKQAGLESNTETTDEAMSVVAKSHDNPHSIIPENLVLKQEKIDVPEQSDLVTADDLSTETYILQQQQQLSYQTQGFSYQDDEFGDAQTSASTTFKHAPSETEEPPPKRKRLCVKEPLIESEEEEIDDPGETCIAKIEEESESELDDPEPTTFVGVPSTSVDDQPGPSGVGQIAADAPYKEGGLADPLWLASTMEIKTEAATAAFVCTFCEKSLDTVDTLERHLLQLHAKRLCRRCLKMFNSIRLLECHVRLTHKGTTELKFGSASSKPKNKEANREKIAFPGSVAQCVHCGKQFEGVKLLNLHIKSKHMTVKCDLCGKQCTRDNYLTHFCPQKCDICEATFDTATSLKIHRRIHENQSCLFCNKKFAFSSALKNHIMCAHSTDAMATKKEKTQQMLVCLFCKKKFARAGALRNHVSWVHLKEKKRVS